MHSLAVEKTINGYMYTWSPDQVNDIKARLSEIDKDSKEAEILLKRIYEHCDYLFTMFEGVTGKGRKKDKTLMKGIIMEYVRPKDQKRIGNNIDKWFSDRNKEQAGTKPKPKAKKKLADMTPKQREAECANEILRLMTKGFTKTEVTKAIKAYKG